MKRFLPTWNYGHMQAALWGTYAVFLSFASNFLLGKGLNGNQLSLVLGLTTGCSIGLQVLLAEMIQRIRVFNPYRVMLLAGILMLAGCCCMVVGNTAIAICGFCVVCMLLQILPAMVNASGMESIRNGSPISYGVARGCGSLSYSLLSLLAGVLVKNHGYGVIGMISGCVVVWFLFSVFFFHRTGERTDKAPLVKEKKQSGFFKRYKRFFVFLIGCTLLMTNHNLVCNFMLQVMQSMDAGAAEQGTALAIGAALEIPVMFLFTYLCRKIKLRLLLWSSSIFFVAHSAMIFMAPSPIWVYTAQIFQMLGFALFSVSSVPYAAKVVAGAEGVQAQTYLAATTTIGSLIALSTGGVLCEQLGARTMLLIATIVSALGAIIVLATVKRSDKAD